LTEELVNRYGRSIANLTLRPSGGGVFDVTLDGTRIFSKKQSGRFPRAGEIPTLIDQHRRQ
jgi:selenoprotein W-related protein